MKYPFSLFLLILLTACHVPESGNGSSAFDQTTEAGKPTAAAAGLSEYWYQGKAELNGYRLTQARYGNENPGEAVVIFVSEDFLTGPQVKNDYYRNPNTAPIMKSNQIRRFTTGIYDYSVFTSVFTPTAVEEFPQTLKVTMSSQDWCGQTYDQLNLRDGQYRSELHSYFEAEADKVESKRADFLEDEVMTRIRMAPDRLPVGNFSVIPALHYLRLTHKTYDTYQAAATLEDYTGTDFPSAQGRLRAYTLRYPEFEREVVYVFSAAPPYYLEGWLDTYPDGREGSLLTTKAVRTGTLLEPYWQQQAAADRDKRRLLGL